MSDKSNKYGYVGVDIPAQSFGANKGVFNPAEINDLVADNKWTTFGQLELIETQTVSSASVLDFVNIDEQKYNVHLLTINFSDNTSALIHQISNDKGANFISSGYQKGAQYGSVGGTFGIDQATNSIADFGSSGTGVAKNGYIYFYNLGDSTKYSFATFHSFSGHNTLGNFFIFGSGVYPNAQINNAIRISSLGGVSTGTASLYGIRYS